MRKRSRRRMLSWSFSSPLSLRFLDDPDDDEAAKKAEAEKQRQAEIAKAKQLAEQEAANARRAREQVAQLQADNEAIKAELDKLKATATEQGIKVPDLDESEYTDGDVPIVQAIKALQTKLDAKDQRIADLEKATAEREKKEAEAAAERQKEAAYNDLLTELDGEYGAQHRNAAVKEFNALVADGKVPNNTAKATRILEKCYKDAVAKVKDRRSSDTTLDPGTGGGTPTHAPRTKLKKGTLAEVVAQLEAST